MRKFSVTVPFTPTYEVVAQVEPFDETVVDPFGFLALEGSAGLFLQEDETSKILLEASVTALTSDSTIYTADDTTITADQTFIINTTSS